MDDVLTPASIGDQAREDQSSELARYKAIFHHLQEGFALHEIILDGSGKPCDYRYLEVNPSFERLTGLPAAEIRGRTVRELMPEVEPEWIERRGRVVLTGQPDRFDNYNRALDKWFEVFCFRPAPGQFASLFIDITERKQAEQALRESREDLNRAQAVARTGSWRLDVRRNELLWSDETYRIFGIPPGTPLTYEAFLACVHPDDRALVDRSWKEALRGEPYCIEHRIVIGGEVKWVRERAELEFDRAGTLRGGFGAVQDITEHKQAQAQRELEESRLRSLWEISQHQAETAQELLAYALEEAIRLTRSRIGYIFHYDEEKREFTLADWSKGVMAECSIAEPRTTLRLAETGILGEAVRQRRPILINDFQAPNPLKKGCPPGHVRVSNYLAVPVFSGERIVAVIGVANKASDYDQTDVLQLSLLIDSVWKIVERRRAEQALRELNETLEQQVAERTAVAERRAKQLQALALQLNEAEESERRRIAGLLHDDLQQLLASARFQLSALDPAVLKEQTYGTIIRQVIRLLEESMQKSRRLSQELSPPLLRHSGLAPALHGLGRQMAENHGLCVAVEELHWREPDSPPLRDFLYRSVRELLFNAVKHAGVCSAAVRLSAFPDRVEVSVSDAGRGFAPPDAGKGSGLSGIHERVGLLGGELRVESAPCRGSRLTLVVPLEGLVRPPAPGRADTRRRASHRPPAADGKAGRVLRVLLADDHRLMRRGLVSLLEKQPDIRVVGEASTGQAALERARELLPDVVLMDVSMPGMDGIEATRRIKAELPGVRVIGLSMYQEKEVAERMRAAGAEAFTAKDGNYEVLIEAIRGEAV